MTKQDLIYITIDKTDKGPLTVGIPRSRLPELIKKLQAEL